MTIYSVRYTQLRLHPSPHLTPTLIGEQCKVSTVAFSRGPLAAWHLRFCLAWRATGNQYILDEST